MKAHSIVSNVNPNHEIAAGAQAANADLLKPEWLRIPAAIRIFGLSRSALYGLITDGRVKSISLRTKPGAERGVRLIHYASLAAYIEQAAAEQAEQAANGNHDAEVRP